MFGLKVVSKPAPIDDKMVDVIIKGEEYPSTVMSTPPRRENTVVAISIGRFLTPDSNGETP